MFNSYFKSLVAEREVRERRKLGIRTIAKETGANISTVQRLMTNDLRRPPLDELALICAHFGCTLNDIFRLEDAPPSAE